jgi:hypothetical protein
MPHPYPPRWRREGDFDVLKGCQRLGLAQPVKPRRAIVVSLSSRREGRGGHGEGFAFAGHQSNNDRHQKSSILRPTTRVRSSLEGGGAGVK